METKFFIPRFSVLEIFLSLSTYPDRGLVKTAFDEHCQCYACRAIPDAKRRVKAENGSQRRLVDSMKREALYIGTRSTVSWA